MKHYLWIINTSLTSIFCAACCAALLFMQDAPPYKTSSISRAKSQKPPYSVPIEDLFGPRDIFGLFVPPELPTVQKKSVPRMPQFTPPPPPQAPKNGPQKLLPALSLTLNGIIFSSKHEKSIAMITDDTNKEASYKLGQPIKDGIIIKIGQDRVVILRNNGQQETFFLRKDIASDAFEQKSSQDTADLIALEKNPDNYMVSKQGFIKRVANIGEFMQDFDLLPAYEKGILKGLRVGQISQDSPAHSLGLQTNDIITKVNDYNLVDLKQRTAAFNTITKLKENESFNVELLRSSKPLKKTYTLVFTIRKQPAENKESNQENQKNKPISWEAPVKKTKPHMTQESYNEMINSMRQQLLDNMRTRPRASRIR